MRNTGDVTDRAHRCSEACTRAGIAALVLALVATGLAEKFRTVLEFEAYATYSQSRQLLDTSLRIFLEGRCWEAFKRTRLASSDPDAVRLGDIYGLECDPDHDDGAFAWSTGQNQVHLVLGASGSRGSRGSRGSLASHDSGTQSSSKEIEKSSISSMASADSQAAPMAPQSISIIQRRAMLGVNEVAKALTSLSDEATMQLAQTYSWVSRFEIYEWVSYSQLIKDRALARIRTLPLNESESTSKLPQELAALTLADLSALAHVPYTSISGLHTTMQSEFRAVLPDTAMGIGINSAAFAVLFGMIVVMLTYLAYALAFPEPSNSGPATLFYVFNRSMLLSIGFCFISILPAASATDLIRSIPRRGWLHWVAVIVVWILTFFVINKSISVRLPRSWYRLFFKLQMDKK